MVIKDYLRKQVKSEINKLTLQLKELDKQDKENQNSVQGKIRADKWNRY